MLLAFILNRKSLNCFKWGHITSTEPFIISFSSSLSNLLHAWAPSFGSLEVLSKLQPNTFCSKSMVVLSGIPYIFIGENACPSHISVFKYEEWGGGQMPSCHARGYALMKRHKSYNVPSGEGSYLGTKCRRCRLLKLLVMTYLGVTNKCNESCSIGENVEHVGQN